MKKYCKQATISRYCGKGTDSFKMIEQHFYLPKKLNYTWESEVTAKYSLFKQRFEGISLGNDVSMEEEEHNDPLAQFLLKAHWSEGETLNYFAKPPSRINIEVKFSPGWRDPRLGYYELSNDIADIMCFCEWVDKGETAWQETDIDTNVIDEVFNYIETCSDVKENNVDFTTILWPILRKCQSHKTIKEALEMLIDAIKKKKVNVIVDSDNRTTLGRMIRTVSADDYPTIILEPLTCTHILLELGAYYMKSHLCFLYASQGLVPSMTDIEPYFMEGSVDSPKRILNLFLALQTVVTVKTYISISNAAIIQFTKNTIRYYLTAKDPLNDFYTFSIKALDFQQICFSDCFLTEWKTRVLFTNPKTKKLRLEIDFHFNECLSDTAKYCKVPEGAGDTEMHLDQDMKDIAVNELKTAVDTTNVENVTVVLTDEEKKYIAKNVFYACSVTTSHFD